MLEGRPEVSELHSIEGAKVPLMRFKFNGILVDFPYVQLPVINAAEVNIRFSICVCVLDYTLNELCLLIMYNLYSTSLRTSFLSAHPVTLCFHLCNAVPYKLLLPTAFGSMW
jgi:poly(A) polymerase Pap1